mmetsp:Transcript_6403/g.9593  ORF Transcript_6403/g.9593 Transcript_6403/m.9593 type:complete len:92 (+) Transcript_6403:113-388(+)
MSIKEVSRKLFMNLPVVGHKTGSHHLSKLNHAKYIADYYPKSLNSLCKRYLGFVPPDPIQKYRLEKLEVLRIKGRGPPKKGSGKRAIKRNK